MKVHGKQWNEVANSSSLPFSLSLSLDACLPFLRGDVDDNGDGGIVV